MGGDAVHEEDVGADGAAFADDGFAADNGGAGVEGDVVFDGGMAFLPAEGLAAGQGTGHQADALVHFHMAAKVGGFANDGSGAVVDEEVGADGGAGVQVHASAAVGPLGHDAGDEGDVAQVEFVGGALEGDGFDEGVGHDDLLAAERGGIAVVGGFDVGLEEFADGGETGEELAGPLASERGEILAEGLTAGRGILEALADLGFEPEPDGGEEGGGVFIDLGGVEDVVVEEPWEEEAKKVDGDAGDGGFGGQVGAVEVIDAAGLPVGGQELGGQFGHRGAHGGEYWGSVGAWQGGSRGPQNRQSNVPTRPRPGSLRPEPWMR